jgi:hypothetical protein
MGSAQGRGRASPRSRRRGARDLATGRARRTVEDYEWALTYHLLPHFADHRLSEITIEEVDRYEASKLREGRLEPAQINKTLVRLAQVL